MSDDREDLSSIKGICKAFADGVIDRNQAKRALFQFPYVESNSDGSIEGTWAEVDKAYVDGVIDSLLHEDVDFFLKFKRDGKIFQCNMLVEPPMDFAFCEIHDQTFPLGSSCPFYSGPTVNTV